MTHSRLKTKLNLPTIVVRPPVGPKTYKKVYSHLDSALSAGTPRKAQRSAAAERDEPTTPSKSRIQSKKQTPSRTTARTPQTKTPTAAKSSTKRKHDDVEGDDGLPPWAMAAIRALCQTFKIAQATSNVFVGVSEIARTIREQQAGAASTPAGKRARRVTGSKSPSAVVSAFDETHIPALIIVIAFFTRSHLLGAPEAGEYATQRADAIQAVSNNLPEDVQQDETTMVAMIEDLLREAENGWLDMEWYHNLPEPTSESEDTDEVVKNGTDAIVEDNDRPLRSLEVPKRGFGSMMTDATDYLSDDRQAEYKRWKSGIMRHIAQVERQEKGKALAA